jgi:hypothetical protein
MRRLCLFATLLLGGLFLATRTYMPPSSAFAAQSQKENKEVKVWVNASSGVYHCPGTRWYGNTKHGKYVGECAAIKDGNRPAYGRACGSDCQSGLPASSPSTEENTTPTNTKQSRQSRREGLGQHELRRVSLSRHAVVWQHKARRIHDAEECSRQWLPSGVWQGLPVACA